MNWPKKRYHRIQENKNLLNCNMLGHRINKIHKKLNKTKKVQKIVKNRY